MSQTKEFFVNAGKIYDLLQDDKSKNIFSNIISYRTTGDFKYIDYISNMSIDGYYNTFRNQDSELNRTLQKFENAGKKLVIYGAGYWGGCTYCAIREHIYCFCDKDASKIIPAWFDDAQKLRIISPDELIENKGDYVAVIGTYDYYDEVYSILKQNNIEFLDINIPAILKGYADRQYFDSEVISYSEDEIFVDGGSFDFATSEALLKKHKSVKKIYAFEPNPQQYPICLRRAEKVDCACVLPYGLWDENTELSFSNDVSGASRIVECKEDTVKITAMRLDDVLTNEKVTFIKLDVEGAELNALKGAANSIKAHRPKLAICIYHRAEDIVDIPLYLNSLISDYKFYIRHYTNISGETVLYAL